MKNEFVFSFNTVTMWKFVATGYLKSFFSFEENLEHFMSECPVFQSSFALGAFWIEVQVYGFAKPFIVTDQIVSRIKFPFFLTSSDYFGVEEKLK